MMRRLNRKVRLAISTIPALCISLLVAVDGFAGELDFLSGTWRGEKGSAVIEETWSEALDGQMIGMFRMVESGEPRFYELISIERQKDETLMFVRHFNPGLEAWEERNGALVFDLTSVLDQVATFEQRGTDTTLIYSLTAIDELIVTLTRSRDGKTSETRFEFRRVD